MVNMTGINSELDVSIIVPTFNRRESLKRLLAALNRQTSSPCCFEVLIADDGSTDGTFDMLQSMEPSLRFAIRYCHTSRLGPGPARNAAARLARGALILFTDSDCEPDDRWIDTMLRTVTEDRVVGGRVEVPPNGTWVAKCVNYVMSTWLGGIGSEWRVWGLIPGYRLRTLNAGMTRRLFEELGGFSPSCAHYGEDTELGERVVIRGSKLIHCNKAVVIHRERRSLIDYASEALAKGLAIVRLIRGGAVRPRGIHAIPALLLASLFGAVLPATHGTAIFGASLTFLVAYFVLLLAFAVRFSAACRNVMPVVMVPVVAFALHAGYGVGTLLGLLHIPTPRKGAWAPCFSVRTAKPLSCDAHV